MENQELVRYSSYFHGPEEKLEELSRIFLAELLTMAAYSISREPEVKEFHVHEVQEIVLELETDLWDKRFVLRLKREKTADES